MKMEEKRLRILFVCTGNICRSPMAEGILKDMVPTDLKNRFEIKSAGINTTSGMRVSASAAKVSEKNGININSHLSSQIDEKMISGSNLIFVMAQEHLEFFRNEYTTYLDKVYLLKKFENPDTENSSIIDPIGMDIESYEKIFNEIKGEIERIFPNLIKIVEDNE